MNTESTEAATHTLLAVLDAWTEAGWLRLLEGEFARFVDRLQQEAGQAASPLLVLLSALVSHQVGRGHVCLDLRALLADPVNTLALPPDGEERMPPELTGPRELLAPWTLADCLAVLDQSPLAGTGSVATPLVRVGHRLYLYRFWRYEQTIIQSIRERLASPLTNEPRQLRQALDSLFEADTGPDYQKIACALAARHRFSVITGGPGTGKTTTVVRLLALLQALAGESPLRIRLAAPTGKAAARLGDSISGAVHRLPLEQLPGQVRPESIPTRVTTLHRLMGSRPGSRRFRHGPDNPLPLDILVVDEASMVDVDLMAKVFEALPDHARLVLLGDKDQLASVDAGAVLGELCQRADAGHYTPETVQWVEQATGQLLPDALRDPNGRPLDQAVAMLRTSYRFQEDSGIGQLAEAVNRDRVDARLLDRCREGYFGDVLWIGRSITGAAGPEPVDQDLGFIGDHALSGSPERFGAGDPPRGYGQYLQLLKEDRPKADAPQAAWDSLARRVLDAFGRFQVLCALRQGPWGVEALNGLIARRLQRAGLLDAAEGWYSGRPILVTANDYNLGLMNGDIGITLAVPGEGGAASRTRTGPGEVLRVAFPAADGEGIRWISPSRLQQLETVFAMTVHKSQGSEFDHACLVLPDHPTPVLSRELIYTGITRARHHLSLVIGSEAVFRLGVRHGVVRSSGLAEGLLPGSD